MKRNIECNIYVKDYDYELEEYQKFDTITAFDANDDNIMIEVYLDKRNLLDILKDKNLLIESKNTDIQELKESKTNSETINEIEEGYNYLLNNFDNLLDEIDFFSFNNENNIMDFVNMNSFLRDRKIVISKNINITDFERIQELTNKYKELNAYVKLIGNEDYVSLEECKKTLNCIKNIGEGIKSLNLSQFETIIYVYDIVRDRCYKFEEENERYTKSRDLSKVIFGDAIVCKGYSELFSAFLNYIGIETRVTFLELKNKDEGHARNEIKINDPKYDINGLYYFDTTFDSKREDMEEVYSYKFLAKTRDEMEELENYQFMYNESSKYNKNMINEFIELYKNNEAGIFEKNYIENIKNYMRTFNYISRATTGNSFVSDYLLKHIILHSLDDLELENIKSELTKILKDFNKPIPAEVYISAINEVRKKEYYINPDKYPYSIYDLYKILIYSNWEFASHHYSARERLFMAIFDDVPEIDNSKDIRKIKERDFLNFITYELGNPKDIYGVQLTKILSKELERKKNS